MRVAMGWRVPVKLFMTRYRAHVKQYAPMGRGVVVEVSLPRFPQTPHFTQSRPRLRWRLKRDRFRGGARAEKAFFDLSSLDHRAKTRNLQ